MALKMSYKMVFCTIVAVTFYGKYRLKKQEI